MSAKRFAAVGAILLIAAAGWWILGTATLMRSDDSIGRLGSQVEGLWGSTLVQQAPTMSIDVPGGNRVRPVLPDKNEVRVELTADYRKKGLIWYPTYLCRFKGTYSIANTEEVAQKVRLHFDFPARDGTYDEFAVTIGGRPLSAPVNTAEGINEIVELAPAQHVDFQVAYLTRGLGEWRYKVSQGVGRVQNLDMAVQTNFSEVDYPDACLSPTAQPKAGADGTTVLAWKAKDLITKEDIGVVVPERLNPGPLTSRITFFAPVCLIFFFVLIGAINIVADVNIHPMHYLFVAAGFFAFHLLLDYMCGLVNIHVAFITSAIVSMTLVTGYLYVSLKRRFPWKVAIAGQSFFLVLFSYSFFLKGITGLTVAIGSVITLAVLMRVTAHIDWDTVFAREKTKPAPVPPPLPKAIPAQADSTDQMI